MTSGYGLLVRFRLHDDAGAAFDALVAGTVEQIRSHEPETLVYVTHGVPDRPHERVFYELYRDEAAFTFHGQQPYVQQFLREREKYVEDFTVDVLRPAQGKVAGGSAAG